MVRRGTTQYAGASGFWNTRFNLLEQSLSPENAAKFRSMPFAKKKRVVGGLIERGAMI